MRGEQRQVDQNTQSRPPPWEIPLVRSAPFEGFLRRCCNVLFRGEEPEPRMLHGGREVLVDVGVDSWKMRFSRGCVVDLNLLALV